MHSHQTRRWLAWPSLVIFDHAEALLASHRAEFLVNITPLVKLCTQLPSTLQLVFVVRSDEAVRSLEALNGGWLFRVFDVDAPIAERDAADVGVAPDSPRVMVPVTKEEITSYIDLTHRREAHLASMRLGCGTKTPP